MLLLPVVLLIPQLVSALQVTPNSPCASKCLDSDDLDASDPNSSHTRNSDVVCEDNKFSSAKGQKWQTCMSCLETSTFSQGGESDTMWFLCYIGLDVCTTTKACGPLRDGVEHGLLDQKNMTAYSYCKAGAGGANDLSHYEGCLSCVAPHGSTDYLTNYFKAMEAGCAQQPAPGVPLGLNETVFSNNRITLVDPSAPKDDGDSAPAVGTTTIIGIVAGAVVLLLVGGGFAFVCLRKRKNKTRRASAEADFYSNFGVGGHGHRPKSSISFQCQTHMMSPRFWPGAEEGISPATEQSPTDTQLQRSSIYKPPMGGIDAISSYPTKENRYSVQQKQQDDSIATAPHKMGMPLHQITTTLPPASPPQVYTASSEKVYYSPSDFKSPLSADSVRSTAALLPAIKPYIPAEYGVVGQAQPYPQPQVPSPAPTVTSFGQSPTSAVSAPGTGMTPLLRGNPWSAALEKPQRPVINVPPPPPQQKKGRESVMMVGLGIDAGAVPPKRKGTPTPTGSPVESVEIKTAFKAPPRR
ncbi:uncharacterized protein PODANS_2_2930 [Podospora anserina S mat+]|uniref:Podospora anserina S mat+ genomic DNA chromosome 2, supercontig 2 n=1 Tax=Podospora anserina (strain S / ATCC MYA-4624 / DSM 980 / FGSC 10383) TaxID=515849 RepID=B2B4Y6_PODAN|nr:uncharacterized protein PODANS_2_2930 [Podospora anserina S mat+]CAP72861.1 unnamed protein product [Podospora anserina S mat+]CDP25260.1 Putative protein of unknown function [Podospora anserina S mat+]